MPTIEEVKKRLEHFGVKNTDPLALTFSLDKAKNYIFNNCNIKEIPLKLKEVAIDLACGYYLKTARSSGMEVSEIVDTVEDIEKSISEGDTKIEFVVGQSVGSKFDSMVEWLINSSEKNGNLSSFRRLRW